jgi:ElaB/YqjD/DUF883 family membrane-anchored ribosome-binding protein
MPRGTVSAALAERGLTGTMNAVCSPFESLEASAPSGVDAMNQMRISDGQQLKERLQNGVAHAGDGVVRVDRQLQHFVRTQPLAAAFAALTVGFVLGRIFSKR